MKNKKMTFDFNFWNIILAIFTSSIANILSNYITKKSLYGWLLFFVILIPWLYNIYKKYERSIKFIISGLTAYYYSFDLEENPKVWQEVRKSFYYQGISFNSIIEFFKRWIDEKNISDYKILLLDPNPNVNDPNLIALVKQEMYKKGFGLDVDYTTLNQIEKDEIDRAVDATKINIESTIKTLQNTKPYQYGHLQIRLYNEFTPWWLYILDEKVTYIGILEKGKFGYDSPVLVITKKAGYTGVFDAFMNNWYRIWQSAKSV